MKENNKTMPYYRIKTLLNHLGIKKRELCKAIGINESSFNRWKTCDVKASNLAAVSAYLKVSVDYLLGISDIQSNADINCSGNKQHLLQYIQISKFSDKQCELIIMVINNLMKFNKI